jgi:hypothetical protein
MSRITRVANTRRRFGEADHYLHFRVGGEDYLALPSELERPRARAMAQPEDIPPRARWWQRVWYALWHG